MCTIESKREVQSSLKKERERRVGFWVAQVLICHQCPSKGSGSSFVPGPSMNRYIPHDDDDDDDEGYKGTHTPVSSVVDFFFCYLKFKKKMKEKVRREKLKEKMPE
jgi:hypothetical protein